ncbi:S-adenosyl-L-methionine-dependentmethyltransferases superfamily protein [Striga asiatica]|uniref:S-adenosyl-L-methionine-dependentmethyltransferases superfamily protein n=1 Tax=Striga asiatica TaxID=4170 RepID=A0A5A7Q588_STRAF|nr:S-adenosyl-L-methionine-dependentmethyltransferases superfamily protein [Striga asiatica]
MVGLLSGWLTTQAMATCKTDTSSSSMFLYLDSSPSKTSAVHSSFTIDRTQPGKSAAGPSDPDGARPVNTSSINTPNAYTSASLVRTLLTACSGARYPPSTAIARAGLWNSVSPKSDIRATPSLSSKTLDDFTAPCGARGPTWSSWALATPRAAPRMSPILVVHSQPHDVRMPQIPNQIHTPLEFFPVGRANVLQPLHRHSSPISLEHGLVNCAQITLPKHLGRCTE